MTDSSLKAKEKQDTAQTSADTEAFFSSCPTGTHLIIKRKHQEGRVGGSVRGAELCGVHSRSLKGPRVSAGRPALGHLRG